MNARNILVVLLVGLFFPLTLSAQTPEPTGELAEFLNSVRKQLREAKVDSGVLIRNVSSNTAADRMGVRPGDLIVEFNGRPIADRQSMVDVRAEMAAEPAILTVWREGNTVHLEGPPLSTRTTFGVIIDDYNWFMDGIVERYMLGDRDTAATLTQQAEENDALPRKNLLVAKLLRFSDGPIPQDSEQRELAEELRGLLRLHDFYAVDRWFRDAGRLYMAAFILERAVRDNPEYVDHRLNLGNRLSVIKFNDEAEQVVNYFLDRPRPPLSRYGMWVALSTLVRVSVNREDWEAALRRDRRRIETYPEGLTGAVFIGHVDIASRLLDLDLLEDAIEYVLDRTGPEMAAMTPYVGALAVYVASVKGDTTEARAIVSEVAEKAPELWQRVLEFWTPTRPEVAAVWRSLRQ